MLPEIQGVLALAVRVDVPNLPTVVNTNSNTTIPPPVRMNQWRLVGPQRQLPTIRFPTTPARRSGAQLDFTFYLSSRILTNTQVAHFTMPPGLRRP